MASVLTSIKEVLSAKKTERERKRTEKKTIRNAADLKAYEAGQMYGAGRYKMRINHTSAREKKFFKEGMKSVKRKKL